MDVEVKNILPVSSLFIFENSIYYQTNLLRPNMFERKYLELRAIENRIYSDDVVKRLPDFDRNSEHKREWTSRSHSYKRLVDHLSAKKTSLSILEIGCGNGWLSNNISRTFSESTVFALDINETELLQGQRVFHDRGNLKFVYADIFTCDLSNQSFDIIILAACTSYMKDLSALFSRLLDLLSPLGEIHLIDNPIYQPDEIDIVRKRSGEYIKGIGCPEMKLYYHHHDWSSFQQFYFEVLYDPLSIPNRFRQFARGDSPFPWIKVMHQICSIHAGDVTSS
jgi:SAM-dependent methyltransferase